MARRRRRNHGQQVPAGDRAQRAISSIEAVGRVHVHRWGDGSEHFHVWFQGRPARRLELYGWGNVLWSQILPPLSAEETDANHTVVIEHLHAAAGGVIADRSDAPGAG